MKTRVLPYTFVVLSISVASCSSDTEVQGVRMPKREIEIAESGELPSYYDQDKPRYARADACRIVSERLLEAGKLSGALDYAMRAITYGDSKYEKLSYAVDLSKILADARLASSDRERGRAFAESHSPSRPALREYSPRGDHAFVDISDWVDFHYNMGQSYEQDPSNLRSALQHYELAATTHGRGQYEIERIKQMLGENVSAEDKARYERGSKRELNDLQLDQRLEEARERRREAREEAREERELGAGDHAESTTTGSPTQQPAPTPASARNPRAKPESTKPANGCGCGGCNHGGYCPCYPRPGSTVRCGR